MISHKNNNNWLSGYRGALCGVLTAGPLALAIALNMVLSPLALLAVIIAVWFMGGICGHIMQSLMR